MLKAAAGAGALFALAAALPARADTLVTGAIRDQAGAAIAGARVTAYDAAGQRAGADVAIADGTFAIASRERVVQIAVACDYCRPVRRGVEAGMPVIVIVQRFAAVTANGPSAADVRALPYRSAADLASLRPFTVVDGGRISDRGLAYEGSVLVDGLPFYRVSDANDLSTLVPAHAVAALAADSPLAAPVYGGYAGGGTYDVQLRDADLATSRIDTGDASDIDANAQTANAGAQYAASSDPGDDRQAASVDGRLPFAGGNLSLDAVGLADTTLHASGASLSYLTESRRFTTAAAVDATQSDGASLLAASAFVRSRGPLQWEYGARALRATSELGTAVGTQFDSALYVRAARQSGASRLSALFAWDRGADSSVANVTHGTSGSALVGSLADDVKIGAFWTLHAGVVSSQRIPTFVELSTVSLAVAADRSLLFEQSVTYTDLHRMRVSGTTYTQRTTGSTTLHVNGIGIDSAWQIAPQLSLRAWVLRANSSSTAAVDPFPPYDPGTLPSTASALTRRLVWLSYDNGLRVDALVRGGALEGDVRIPFNGFAACSIGTTLYKGSRVTTFGLTLR
jgi:hypothetical protein